ncbi:MAG: molybdopterin-guanine dinucleotide biosynthesis protein B, partial [Caldilineales bacterium]|nr:molybdopterin-guanine dinucleotide biosynthesis protein B [Caldilineales bacterium]
DAVARRLAPPVVSVVAKSGTGKTTFLEKLIPALRRRGVRVGVLKHHGHPTPFDVPGKDTYRLAQAGAEVVIGASAVQVAIFRQEDGAADLDAVVARHAAGLDLVLTEGYKRGGYPKIEVHRAERSRELLCRPDELLALVTDTPWPLAVPQFGLDDADGVADLLVAWLRR